MTIWTDSLSAVYASAMAVDAVILPPTSGAPVAVRAMDKTSGVVLATDTDAEYQSVVAVAVVQMTALADAGLVADTDLDGGTITLDGKAWTIKQHRLKPSPEGELRGEVVLILSDEAL
jgi:hypothetical protein